MEGWIKLHRSARDNFLYKTNQPHSKREAWEDILMLVNIEDKKVLVGNELIDCKRGQSLMSLDHWGKVFNWNKSAVKRFFDLLQKEKMICTENLSKTTRLTVCNYDIYQGERNANETHLKRKRNANETHLKPTKEGEESKEGKEVNIYSDFYVCELEKSNNDKNYKFFVDYIFFNNETHQKLSGLLSIKNQLEFEQFEKLLNKAKTNGIKLMDIVLRIENDPKYWKNKKSLYLTMNNWIENKFTK